MGHGNSHRGTKNPPNNDSLSSCGGTQSHKHIHTAQSSRRQLLDAPKVWTKRPRLHGMVGLNVVEPFTIRSATPSSPSSYQGEVTKLRNFHSDQLSTSFRKLQVWIMSLAPTVRLCHLQSSGPPYLCHNLASKFK